MKKYETIPNHFILSSYFAELKLLNIFKFVAFFSHFKRPGGGGGGGLGVKKKRKPKKKNAETEEEEMEDGSTSEEESADEGDKVQVVEEVNVVSQPRRGRGRPKGSTNKNKGEKGKGGKKGKGKKGKGKGKAADSQSAEVEENQAAEETNAEEAQETDAEGTEAEGTDDEAMDVEESEAAPSNKVKKGKAGKKGRHWVNPVRADMTPRILPIPPEAQLPPPKPEDLELMDHALQVHRQKRAHNKLLLVSKIKV